MTDEALDGLLRQVMLDAARLELSGAPAEQEAHTFSPAFERRMQKLLRRAEHPARHSFGLLRRTKYPARHRFGRIAACFLLLAALGFSSVMAFNAEARAAVFGWIREVYETYFVYRYEGEEMIAPEDTVYMPTWVPEGYSLISTPEPGALHLAEATYQNADGLMVIFLYTTDPTAVNVFAEQEGVDVQSKTVGNHQADLYLDNRADQPSSIVWTDEETGVIFLISAYLSGEDLIKMAESVTAVDAAELAMANEVYKPTWLPEGYEMTVAPEPGDMVRAVYQGDGDLLAFSYTKNVENASIYVQQEGSDVQSVYVGDIPADLLIDQDGGANILIWTDDHRGATFWISAHLPAEDMIRMAESIEPMEVPRPTPENTLFCPTWQPYGYELVVEPELGTQVLAIYESADGKTALFAYSNADHDTTSALFIPAEGVTPKSVDVNGQTADFYLDNRDGEPNALIWTDDETQFIFFISAHLPAEDMIRMAESVEMLEPDND